MRKAVSDRSLALHVQTMEYIKGDLSIFYERVGMHNLKKETLKPSDHVLWYLQRPVTKQLRENISVDVAIVGGGMAGISAAQAFARRGKKVALFEQYFCGSGATGKSSGFITPNAELSCSDFAARFGDTAAQEIWNKFYDGIGLIESNIKDYGLSCGYRKQDSFMIASTPKANAYFRTEYEQLIKLGYKASIYDAHATRSLIDSDGYFGGLMYYDTFGLDGYAYVQAMKHQLESAGVGVYEESPVQGIFEHVLQLPHAQVTADYIVVCVDRFLPNLGLFDDELFQAQNFILASQQLTQEQITKIFPDRPLMVWDSELIYNYFRLTYDNRLILGGGDLWSTFVDRESYGHDSIVKKLQHYFKCKFPELDLQFEYRWAGLIGISKDIAPLIGADCKDPYRYYIAACAGLPIAAALGTYSAASLLDGERSMEQYFSIYRSFPIGGWLQKMMGKRLSFALSNALNQNIV